METTDQNDPALLDSILDDALRCVRSGGGFSLEEYCQRYPELADELRVMLPALMLLEIPFEESAQSPLRPQLWRISLADRTLPN